MQRVLETERLNLRQPDLTDASFLVELMNSPGWLNNIGDRNVKTVEQAENYLLNGPIASFQVNGFGFGIVELSDSGERIGMCGIIRRDGLEHPDIGYAILPEYAGKGYATEAASAMLRHAVDVLQLSHICAIVNPDNEGSINVLTKIGLQRRGEITLPNDTYNLLYFELPV